MGDALKGPPPPQPLSAEDRLAVALGELAVLRASLRQATSCLHQLTDEVARQVAEKLAAERGNPTHAG